MKKLFNIIFIFVFIIIGFALMGYIGVGNNLLRIYDNETVDSIVIDCPLIHKDKIEAWGYRGESTIAVTVTDAATWYHLTNATNDLFWANFEGQEMTISNDTIIVGNYSGVYDSYAVINFEGTANQTYKFRIFNVTKNTGMPVGSAQDGSGNDIVGVSILGHQHSVNIGDRFIIQFQNADGTGNLTFKSGSWMMELNHRE